MDELKQIETMSLRDFIHREMTKLCQTSEEIFTLNVEEILNRITELHSVLSQLEMLQEIAYRLEYGFITEIGNTSLKEHLVKPS